MVLKRKRKEISKALFCGLLLAEQRWVALLSVAASRSDAHACLCCGVLTSVPTAMVAEWFRKGVCWVTV